MASSDWSNGIRYHIFDTRPDAEFEDARVHLPNSMKVKGKTLPKTGPNNLSTYSSRWRRSSSEAFSGSGGTCRKSPAGRVCSSHTAKGLAFRV